MFIKNFAFVVLAFASTSFTPPEFRVLAHKNPKADNPLLAEWTGKYNGFPPFDKVDIADFEPAFEVAMAANDKEINAIVTMKAMPSFENTIVELERSGRVLGRVSTIYDVWGSNMNTPEFETVQNILEPKLAAFRDKIIQNADLFKKVEAVYLNPNTKKLTLEKQRLVWRYYTNFVFAGAKLDEKAKAKVADINQKLAV